MHEVSFLYRLHCSGGHMDGEVAADDEAFPISEWRADYIRPGKSHEPTFITLQLLFFSVLEYFRVDHCQTME